MRSTSRPLPGLPRRTCPGRRLLFPSLLALLTAAAAHAHPYLPLEPGAITVLSYHFQVRNATITPAPEPVRGEMTLRSDRFEDKHGRRYLRQVATYRNIPYMTEPQHTWRREENGNVYAGSLRTGQWHETLELPADVSVGREWDYDDGEKSRRKIRRKLDIKRQDGATVADCLEVSRIILANQRLQQVVHTAYYCRDIGDAGSLFRMPSPIGDYTTETRLKNHRRPGEGPPP